MVFLAVLASFYYFVKADDCGQNCDSSDYNCLSQKVSACQQELAKTTNQKNTLKSQITTFDKQISLTELKIEAAQASLEESQKKLEVLNSEIGDLTGKISDLEGSISDLYPVLIERIKADYETSNEPLIEAMLTSNNVTDYMGRLKYLQVVQAHDKKLLSQMQTAKASYTSEKTDLGQKKIEVEALEKEIEAEKAKIEDQKATLETQRAGEQRLLAITQNDEARYQQLLTEAQAQISAFKSYAAFAGGGILPPQPSPDGWYYNQRDNRWATNTIGGSSEQIWDVGCLVTATAMVMKKHGQNVTPGDVAANHDYYFLDTAYMLIPWAGGKFSSNWGFDQSAVDSKLSSGEPVIVGVRAGAYGMHFIVLKSGSGGNYVMNDPWNGPDLKFTDYYTTSQIFQYGFYSG